MKIFPVFSSIIFSLFLACSSTKNSADIKKDSKSYNNLFIIANTGDIEIRVRLEKEFAAAAESKGYKVVKSIDAIHPSLNDPKPPSKEEFINKVKASGCNALFVIYCIRKADAINYIPGSKFDGTDPLIIGLVSGILGYKGKVEGNEYSKSISTPGSYSKEKGFFILSDLFDAASEEIIYSEKSEIFDDANLIPFSKGYMTDLVKYLEIKKILIK